MSISRQSTPEFLQGSPSHSSPRLEGTELTPRSKIKALLATVDDSSDSSPVKKRSSVQLLRGSDEVKDIDHNITEKPGSASDSSESDALPSKKKRAARPNVQAPVSSPPSPTIQDGASSNAYERIKRKLLGKSKPLTRPSDEDTRNLEAPPSPPRVIRKFLTRKKPTGLPVLENGHSAETGPDNSNRPSPHEHGAGAGSDGSNDAKAQSPKRDSRRLGEGEGRPADADSDEDEELADPLQNDRFWELVRQKRAERETKEAHEQEKRQARRDPSRKQPKASSRNARDSELSDIGNDSEDSVDDRKLTQHSRPARKASKKAMEEMSRETQRISRNMQLTHEATTKKRVTKESLLSRFRPRAEQAPNEASKQSSSTVPSSAPASDAGLTQVQSAPLTSPGLPFNGDTSGAKDFFGKENSKLQAFQGEGLDTMAPTIGSKKLDKGEGKAIVPPLEEPKPKPTFTQRPIKIRPPKCPVRPEGYLMDSGSDLEIVQPSKKTSRAMQVLSRIPEKRKTQDRSRVALRALANLTSPGKKRSSKGGVMTQGDLQASLQARARQQAAKERAGRLEDLKRRGIVVKTVEDREKEQMDVENLLEKARQEDDELRKLEKDEAKRERRKNGEADVSSSSDEDFQDEGAEDVEISESEEADDEGNEESEEAEDDEADDGESQDAADSQKHELESALNPGASLIEDEAADASTEASEANDDEKVAESDEEPDLEIISRRRPRKRVLEDDDAEDAPTPTLTLAPADDFVVNPFGVAPGVSNSAPMGLTQAFAATMSDSQLQQEDSMANLPPMTMPDPPSPGFDTLVADSQRDAEPTQTVVGESQPVVEDTQGINLQFTQSQIVHDSFEDRDLAALAQPSQMPDPTQDAGFEHPSPIGDRFARAPPSTVETVLLAEDRPSNRLETKKKGRLRRRVAAIADLSDDDNVLSGSEKGDFEVSANAFDVMKTAMKKPRRDDQDFNKKDSKAKEMVEELAEESEDEYAGLGGASDEDSEAEDVELQKMIDEEEVDVDERKIAAFFADKERARDEKAIEKLYKDINTGALRRKRGADFDLSDSDDAMEVRQRRKRQAFARMQKALLEDEAIKKIADNPKKRAFLRAIEDHDPDDEMDFLLETPLETQEQDSIQEIPDSQAENRGPGGDPSAAPSGLKCKRPLEESHLDSGNRRPPAPERRTATARKPPSFAEMRESLSFLTEHPADASLGTPVEPSSPLSGAENHEPHPRRRRAAPGAVVDRLSVKRADSAASTTSASGARMAFHDPRAGRDATGFRVPSLLRRATSSFSTDEHGISHGPGATGRGGEREGVRMGGTKKSGVGWLVKKDREKKMDAKNEERVFKVGKSKKGKQQGGFIANLLGQGSWE